MTSTAKVTVVTGGSTPERHVALAGAAQVVGVLRARGYGVRVVDTCGGALTAAEEEEFLQASVGVNPPAPEELRKLARQELGPRLVEVPEVLESDLLFLVLHGRQGEGGQLQALLELAGLTFIGSGALGSAVAMDKDVAKRLFVEAGIPTPRWLVWPGEEEALRSFGPPWIVKPSKVGSTVGLRLVEAYPDLEPAAAYAAQFDDEVLVEEYVQGRELTVGILGEEALAVGEIIPKHTLFDYECKYTPGMAQEIFPADLDPEPAGRLRSLALRAHGALKLRDFSRVDFVLGPGGRLGCLEANTLPGMTSTSLLPQSAAAAGIDFPELCHRICQLALAR